MSEKAQGSINISLKYVKGVFQADFEKYFLKDIFCSQYTSNTPFTLIYEICTQYKNQLKHYNREVLILIESPVDTKSITFVSNEFSFETENSESKKIINYKYSLKCNSEAI